MESNYYDNNYYEVEKIISRKKINGKIESMKKKKINFKKMGIS